MNWMTSAKKRIYKTKKQKDQQKRIAAKSRLVQEFTEPQNLYRNRTTSSSHRLSYDEKILQGSSLYEMFPRSHDQRVGSHRKVSSENRKLNLSSIPPQEDQGILYFEDGVEMWNEQSERKEEAVTELEDYYDWEADLELSDNDTDQQQAIAPMIEEKEKVIDSKGTKEIKPERKSPITSLVQSWEIFDGKIDSTQSHAEQTRKRKYQEVSRPPEAICESLPQQKKNQISSSPVPSTVSKKEDGYFDIEDINMAELL